MTIILLLLSIAGYVITILGMGALSKRLFRNNADQLYFQLIRNVICLIIMAAIYRAIFPSVLTILLAAAMGAALLICSVFSIIAYQRGPVSISVLITSSLAMVISALAGPVFWGEAISAWQITGIVLSVASMVLLTERTLIKETSFFWIVALFLTGLSGGMQGVIQKILAMSAYAAESNEFVTYSVLFSMLGSLAMLLVVRRKKDEHVSYHMNWKICTAFALQAVLYVFLNVNNLKLVASLPTVIFFPAYSIGGLLLTTIASIILFREKMTGRQIAGFIVGLAALLLISGTLESIKV